MNGQTDIDDEDYTYERVQYAQIGQCHNLGDEVRDLRKKVQELTTSIKFLSKVNDGHVEKIRKLESERHYWYAVYCDLAVSVNHLSCLYGWGGDPKVSYEDRLERVASDILSLRARVRELKGRK